MKKLLLLLVGCVVAFAAAAQDQYLKVPCKANNYDEYAGVKFGPDGIATYSYQKDGVNTEKIAIGTDGFYILVWNGSANVWYHTSNQIVPNQWTTLTSQTSKPSSVMSIKDATAAQEFTVKFNINTKQVIVTSESAPVTNFKTFYLVGNFNSWKLKDANYKFETTDGKVYTLTTTSGIKKASVSGQDAGFKINEGNWDDVIFGKNEDPKLDEEFDLYTNSGDNIEIDIPANATITLTYNEGGTSTMFIKTKTAPVTTFKRFHIIGKFNEWNQNDYTYEFETEDGVTYTLTLDSDLEQIGNGFKVKEVGANKWFGVDANTTCAFNKTIPLDDDGASGNIKFSKDIPAESVITFTYKANGTSTFLVETNDVADETPDAIYMHFKYDLSEYGKTGAVPYCQYYNKNNTNEKSAVKVMTLESDRYSIWKALLSEEEATKYNAVKFWFDKDDGTANYDSTKDSGDWTVAFFDSDNWTKYIYATSSRDHNKVGNYEYAVQTYLSYARFKQLDQLDINNGGRRNLYLVGWGKTDDTYIQYYDDNDSEVPKNMPKEVTNSLKLDQDGGCFYLTILPDGGSFKISWLSVADAINKLPEGYDKTDRQREWATFDLGLIGVDKDHKYPSNEYKPKYERNDGVNGKVYFVRNRSVRYMNYNQADWVLPTSTDNLPGVGRKRWLVVDTHCAYNADGSIDEANSCKTATITSFDPNPSVEVTVSGVQPRKEPLADDVAKAMHHDCLYGAEANGHIYMKNVNYAVADVKINATNLEDVENSSFSRLYTLYVNNKVVGTHSGTNLENLHIDYFPLSYDVEGNSMSVRAKYTDSNTNLNFHSRTGEGQVKTDVKFKAPQEEILEGQYVFEGYAEDGQEIYGVYVKGLDCQVADNDYNVYSDFRFDRGSYADFVDENHYLYTASKGAFPAWDGWSNGGDWSSKLMADRELAPLFIHNVVRVANLDELKAMDDKEITCTLYAVYPFMYNPNATFTVNAETPASAPALRANEDFTGFKVFNTAVPTSFSFKVSADNAVSGVEGIEADVEAENTEAVYYTVSGVKVVGDPAPGIYVRVQGAKAEKVVIR